MSEWIPTSERIPKRNDAGYWRHVLVLPLDPKPWIDDEPFSVPFHLVRKTYHRAWMRIPDPPNPTI